jgi:peptidyl-prolyl cis-trans isomerase A (cyclophilin A)
MKTIMAGIVLCTCLLAQAQAPAPKSSSASKSTTHVMAAGSHPSMLNPKSLHATAPAIFKAKFTTSLGDFVVEVHRDWAPLGADRFYNLVRNGYYTNAAFFRVITGFVAQFGLSANPAVNKAWKEATLKDDPVTQSNKRGTIVFADAGPNTRTTQLFINFADNSRLDAKGFAPFGTVTEGMDVVDKIFPGYRDQPDQDQITEKGDAYLKANFPFIDRIKVARILPAAPAAHAPSGSKPSAKPSPKPTQH